MVFGGTTHRGMGDGVVVVSSFDVGFCVARCS